MLAALSTSLTDKSPAVVLKRLNAFELSDPLANVVAKQLSTNTRTFETSARIFSGPWVRAADVPLVRSPCSTNASYLEYFPLR